MVEITNHKDLEAWLKDRPREDAVLIAARAALRVFPLLAPVLQKDAEDRRAAIILPACRAMAVASFASTSSRNATELREAAAAAFRTVDNAHTTALMIVDSARSVFDTLISAATVPVVAHAAQSEFDEVNDASTVVKLSAEFVVAVSNDSALADYADVALRATAASDSYATVSYDAWALGLDANSVSGAPLWPGGATQRVSSMKYRLRDHLLAADEGWEVWTDWYQDRLDGKPANEELELAKCLIPDEIWKAGPKVLNAEIKRLIQGQRILSANMDTSGVDPEASAIQSLDASEPYALSDFGYDETANAMAPRPLPNDPPPPEDPYRMRDQADHLSTLSDLAKGLERDFRQDKPQIPQALRRNLKDYSAEAGKAPEQVRPRMLMALAEKFQLALQDEDIRGGMNNFEIAGLEGLMREHLGLVAAYYDTLSERLQSEIDKYEPPAEVGLEELEQKSSDAADLIERIETNPLPSPPPGYVDEVRTELADLRDGRLRLGLITDEQIRADGARQLARDNLELISTASREIVRWTQVVIRDDRFVVPTSVYTALTFVRDALRFFGLPL